MSIVCFSDEELSVMYGNLARVMHQPDFSMAISDEELKSFLVRVGISNRLASEFSNREFGLDRLVLKIPQIRKAVYWRLSPKLLSWQFDMLSYNCVTNSGRCFLDSDDKKLLDEIVHKLQLRYINTLKKGSQYTHSIEISQSRGA